MLESENLPELQTSEVEEACLNIFSITRAAKNCSHSQWQILQLFLWRNSEEFLFLSLRDYSIAWDVSLRKLSLISSLYLPLISVTYKGSNPAFTGRWTRCFNNLFPFLSCMIHLFTTFTPWGTLKQVISFIFLPSTDRSMGQILSCCQLAQTHWL